MNPFPKSLGSANRRAKLTESKVRQIRASKETKEQLAKRHNVSVSTIDKVLRRHSWAHVD